MPWATNSVLPRYNESFQGLNTNDLYEVLRSLWFEHWKTRPDWYNPFSKPSDWNRADWLSNRHRIRRLIQNVEREINRRIRATEARTPPSVGYTTPWGRRRMVPPCTGPQSRWRDPCYTVQREPGGLNIYWRRYKWRGQWRGEEFRPL